MQHLGKTLFVGGHDEDGGDCFARALHLREQFHADDGLVASSRLALDRARQLAAAPGSVARAMSAEGLRAKVLTVSDGVVAGTRDDASGRALVEQLTAAGFEVVAHEVTADGADAVAAALSALSDGFAGLIVTTGGTGFAPGTRRPRAPARSSTARRPVWPRRCASSARTAGCPAASPACAAGRSCATRRARRRAASSSSGRSSTCSRTPCACSTSQPTEH